MTRYLRSRWSSDGSLPVVRFLRHVSAAQLCSCNAGMVEINMIRKTHPTSSYCSGSRNENMERSDEI